MLFSLCSPCLYLRRHLPPYRPRWNWALSSSKPGGAWAHTHGHHKEGMVGKEQERGQWLSCPLTPLPSSHPNSWLSQGIWTMCLPRGLEEEAEQAWNSPCLDVSCQGHRHVGFVLVPQPGTVHGTEQTHPIVCSQKRSEIILNRSRGRGPPLITHLLLHPLVYGV